MDFVRFLWFCDGLYHSESEAVLSIFVQPRIPLSYFKARLHFSLNIFFRLVNRLYRHDINRNQTLFTLTFWSLLETFVRRSCSILLPVLATVVMWRGKRSVVRMAQCTAALGCRTGCKVHIPYYTHDSVYTVLARRRFLFVKNACTAAAAAVVVALSIIIVHISLSFAGRPMLRRSNVEKAHTGQAFCREKIFTEDFAIFCYDENLITAHDITLFIT